MKVTVIAGYFPPEQSADSRLNQDLVFSLAESGMDVTLIVPFPTRGVSEDAQASYLSRRDEQCHARLRILRAGSPGKYRQDLLRRGLSFLKKSASLYYAARNIESDIYLVVSTPPFLGYVAALLAKKKPVIYKLQDIFPDSLIHSKKLEERNLLARVLRKLERWVYRNVTEIIASSDDMKATLMTRGVQTSKISVIYDWVDETKCYPIAKKDNPLFQKFKLPTENFYVCYAGNIGLLQNIETIVRASALLQEKAPDIKFILIGDGAWKPCLDKMLAENPCENVRCFPMQPMDEIAAVYSLGDIGLVSLKPDITRFALPSKTWDILAAGRPVICEIDQFSQLSSLIEKCHCGYSVAPGDAESMAARVLELYEHQAKAHEMGQRGRKYIETCLTRQRAMERYCDRLYAVYEGVWKNGCF